MGTRSALSVLLLAGVPVLLGAQGLAEETVWLTEVPGLGRGRSLGAISPSPVVPTQADLLLSRKPNPAARPAAFSPDGTTRFWLLSDRKPVHLFAEEVPPISLGASPVEFQFGSLWASRSEVPDFGRFSLVAGQSSPGPALPSPPPAPLSPKEKLKLALKRSFYPLPLAGAAAWAGWSMAIDSSLDDGYGQGFDGFLRRWGARVAFSGSRHFVGTFALASVLGQDPRYHPSRRRGFGRRMGYALSRVLVTRSDAGARQFNLSNVGGIAAASALANTWYHHQDSGGKETAARFGVGLAVDAASKLFSEFVVHRKAPRD